MKKTKKQLISFGSLANLPGKLAKIKDYWKQSELPDQSSYVPPASVSRSLRSSESIFEVAQIMKGKGGRTGFCALTKSGEGVAELQDGNGNVQIAKAVRTDGSIKFYATEKSGDVYMPYNSDTRKGTVLLMALMALALQDPEANRYYSALSPYLEIDPNDASWETDDGRMLEEFSKWLCLLTTNLYYRSGTPENAGAQRLDYSSSIYVLRESDIKKAEIAASLSEGTPSVFELNKVSAAQSKIENKSVKGKYSVLSKGRTLTEEEQKMLIDLPDWYVFPQWALTVAKKISMSSTFSKPLRSLLLIGPAGAGKTKGAQALSYLFGVPYTKITCSPDSSMFDFVGQLIPNTAAGNGKSAEEAMKELGIPTFDDVVYDFEASYEKLFGKKPGKYDAPQDCYTEIVNRMMQTGNKPDSDFVYVESELIRALRNGWFVEIQEPTVIKRNSVLVGLNGILEDDLDEASITLITGETIKRHPDAVVCMTSNKDYDGCNKIQQSVLSRAQIVRKLGNPAPAVMAERCSKETGFPNAGLMLKMAEMIKSINEYCNSRDITDGVCGPRELSNWAKEAMLNSMIDNGSTDAISNIDIIRAAFSTLLTKASQTDEDVEDIITGCFGLAFPMADIEMARQEYEEGCY